MTKCLLVLAFGAFMGAGGLAFGLWLSESDNYQLSRSEYKRIDTPVCDWRSVKVKCEQFMRK